MKGFLERILQEIMQKNNIWNIRPLVNKMIVPSTQQPSTLYRRFSNFCSLFLYPITPCLLYTQPIQSVYMKGVLLCIIHNLQKDSMYYTFGADTFCKCCAQVYTFSNIPFWKLPVKI